MTSCRFWPANLNKQVLYKVLYQAGMKVASTVHKIITHVSGSYTFLFTILARTLHES